MANASRESYLIHNTSRSAAKREIRRQLVGPDKSRLNLNIGKLVVRRGRPLQVSQSVLLSNIRELIDLEEKGLVEVFTSRSVRVSVTELRLLQVSASTTVEVAAEVETIPEPVVVEAPVVEEEEEVVAEVVAPEPPPAPAVALELPTEEPPVAEVVPIQEDAPVEVPAEPAEVVAEVPAEPEPEVLPEAPVEEQVAEEAAVTDEQVVAEADVAVVPTEITSNKKKNKRG